MVSNVSMSSIVNKCNDLIFLCRGSDLRFSALDAGLSGLGSSPGWGHCLVSLGEKLTLTVPLSIQVGTTELNAEGVGGCVWGVWGEGVWSTLKWTSIPSREE